MPGAAVDGDPKTPARSRLRMRIHGMVQGVGFRPFVFRLAHDLGLAGWVRNGPQGVIIEIEGPTPLLDVFRTRLETEHPPCASIRCCDVTTLAAMGCADFEIRHSSRGAPATALVLPDMATCPDCLRDVWATTDRRHLYPFTNCTNCGPRFSIIESLPYDRANTSMKRFTMCARCQAEYNDPRNRRFHAEPNACPDCGPQLTLWDAAGRVVAERHDGLLEAAHAVLAGRIVAIKGLAGFQLWVDASNENAVRRLRKRKHREEKPFALMIRDLERVEAICLVNENERRLLGSTAAPIVLLRAGPEASNVVASSVAPRNPYLGVMLPCTPLHHILLRALDRPVVATSGNRVDEPICTDETEALRRLEGIADLFLVHDRPIVRHADDSVARVTLGRALLLRRARGYVPLPISMSEPLPPLLAVGAQLKNAPAVARGEHVFLGQYVGDLSTLEAYRAFQRTADDLMRLLETHPDHVAADLHPDYLSSKHAARMTPNVIRVQHHFAHVVACMADNAIHGPVLGVSWDGIGDGGDGCLWGGEFLVCTHAAFTRLAHLRTFPLPGGDTAVREPRRSAAGLLYELLGPQVFDREDLPPIRTMDRRQRAVIRRMIERRLNTPLTSSMGRLFDAVASLLDLRQVTRYEGQAAMELEFLADGRPAGSPYPFDVSNPPTAETPWVIDWGPMLLGILNDIRIGADHRHIAARFHDTLVEMIVAVARESGECRVVLTGGCFQNERLLESAVHRLADEGLEPYWHRHVPPNDGGIALGQAVAAAAALEQTPCA